MLDLHGAAAVAAVAADFSRQLSEYETQADSLPLDVEWCGGDGVVVLWPGLLLVVGPYGDHASWALPEEEKVGVRVGVPWSVHVCACEGQWGVLHVCVCEYVCACMCVHSCASVSP